MTVLLLGMLLGAALASIWLQQRSATRAEADAQTPAPARREAGP